MKIKNNVTISIFIIITILFIILSFFHIYEKFSGDGIPEYLKHKSKSFSAERDMINRCGVDSFWRGQSSKSYDSEKSGVDLYGEAGGAIGKTIKYY
jgi:hypothetical protein